MSLNPFSLQDDFSLLTDGTFGEEDRTSSPTNIPSGLMNTNNHSFNTPLATTPTSSSTTGNNNSFLFSMPFPSSDTTVQAEQASTLLSRNTVVQKNILKFLPPIKALFLMRAINSSWYKSVQSLRSDIYNGTVALSLLTFSKFPDMDRDDEYYRKNNKPVFQDVKTRMNKNYPLTLLEQFTSTSPSSSAIIGPKTIISHLELIGLSIPEMEYILKRLSLVASTNASLSSAAQRDPLMSPSGPTSLTLEAEFFPPTPAPTKTTMQNSTFQSIKIISLTVGWTNKKAANNFSIPKLPTLQKSTPQVSFFSSLEVGNNVSDAYSQFTEPSSQGKEEDEEEDMDDFIEFNDDNQDYTVDEEEEENDDNEIVDVESNDVDEDKLASITVNYDSHTLSIFQQVETLLVVDCINEHDLIDLETLGKNCNLEKNASVDEVELDLSNVNITTKNYRRLLDFVFAGKTLKKLVFLRNPFFYYTEDSKQDMVNSELKPYINFMTNFKKGGSLIKYCRNMLGEVIASEYLIDTKFLKENWQVLLKPLFEHGLLNWNDELYSSSSWRANIVQVVLKSVVTHRIDDNTYSSVLLRSELKQDFKLAYENFLQEEEVVLTLDILETMNETFKALDGTLLPFDANRFSGRQFFSPLCYCQIIDKFFSNIINNVNKDQIGDTLVICWSELLQCGRKRNLIELSNNEKAETTPKKKKILLQ
ncbi:hypothetical protein FDP41_007559 [Naegleria fowleri]|uniref:Uncharacterized protein n=1 Tax=Naegleria fowleri TaxID=5763 RepID=A0A6A5CAR3_NAEFO|nr:uncharacterized protein FDP41_007559 [Naegleria fowleri]KAF0983644.1 hypothetical protein FDP41_007559 [Naegleria fowleri]